MSTSLTTVFIAFIVIAGIVFLINYCRRRLRGTPHGLTGMCRKDGGAMCSSCRDTIKNNPKQE